MKEIKYRMWDRYNKIMSYNYKEAFEKIKTLKIIGNIYENIEMIL